jgi:hypothetical protein
MAKAPPDTRVREVQPITAPGPGEVPCLEVISGKSSGKVFPLRPATSTVGRDPTCDVVLEDDGIRNRPLRIGSTGGTGRRVFVHGTSFLYLLHRPAVSYARIHSTIRNSVRHPERQLMAPTHFVHFWIWGIVWTG